MDADSSLQDPSWERISLRLGRFAGLHLGLELLVLSGAFTLCFELWRCLARSQASPLVQSGFDDPTGSAAPGTVVLLLLGSAGLVWLSRHQLLWTQHSLVAGAGWLQAHLTLPFRDGTTLLLVLSAIGTVASRRRLNRA